MANQMLGLGGECEILAVQRHGGAGDQGIGDAGVQGTRGCRGHRGAGDAGMQGCRGPGGAGDAEVQGTRGCRGRRGAGVQGLTDYIVSLILLGTGLDLPSFKKVYFY